MKTQLLVCVVACMTAFSSWSQATIRGTITSSANGTPIEGAKIKLKNTSTGTLSDVAGKFEIEAKSTDTLVVSSIEALSDKEIAVGDNTFLEIQLDLNESDYSEVVVTALGLKRNKRDLGYAVQTIDTKELTEVRNPNVVNSMAGRIAGVQTTNGSSGVGSSSRIVIRGETSLSGQNQPLFVVDGVPVSNDFIANNTENLENDFQEVDYGNGMGDFGSDDIESITVLKGPGAAALYGARAANGVVVIETKEGRKSNGVGVTINSSLTFDQIAFLPEFQNVYGQGAGGVFAYEDGIGGGIGDGGLVSFGPEMNGQLITQFDGVSYDADGNAVRGGDVIARNGNPITPSAWLANPDNVRSFFQTGVTSTQNIAFSSASDNGNIRLSYTRLDNTGTIPNTNYIRNNVSLTASNNLSTKLKLRTYVNFINSSSDHRPGLGYGSENAMYSFLWMGRQVNLDNAQDYWQAGQEGFNQFNYNTQWLDNPYFNVNENTNAFNKNRVLGNAALTYNANEHLSIRFRSGMDTYSDVRRSKRAFSTQRFKNGAYREDDIFFMEVNTDALVSYNNKIGANMKWNVGVGANNFTQQTNYKSLTANQLSVPNIYNFQNSKVPLVATQFNAQKQINSVYALAGWSWKRAVFVDATFRNDWSSTLPESNNSFGYYSVSSALILSEVIDMPDWITYAKVRASSSSVGNDTDPFQLRNTYSFNQNYGEYPLLTSSTTLLNNNLRPERINALEAGAEVYFFKDRLGVDVSVYQNMAKDQIISLPASAASGYTSRVVNGGKIQSRGVEVALTGTIIQTKNVKWTAFANFSKGASYVLELPEGIDQYTTGYARVYTSSDNSVFYIANPNGGRIGDMYGTGFKKTEDGRIIYDENGLPIRDAELRLLGNYNPDFILGFGNNINIKRISIGFLFDWRQGGTIVSRTKAIGSTSGVLLETLEGRADGIIGDGVVNVGTDENPVYEENTTVVSASEYYNQFYNRANEESALYDATYLKLRQINISYNFPEKWVQKMKVQGLKVGFIATNLFTLSKIPHFDPELSAMQGTNTTFGVEDLSYPSSRTYGFNVQLTF